jgi:hypothetical protein
MKFRKEHYRVAEVPLSVCQELTRELHYAKGGSNTAVYCHGLIRLRDKKVVGIAWWLPPTRVAAESVCRSSWQKVLSLTRMVIRSEVPRNAASFLLSRSVKLIRQDGRFSHLVTYADEWANHTGGVYRAANWLYVGRTGP